MKKRLNVRKWWLIGAGTIICGVVVIALWNRPVAVKAKNLMEGITPNEAAMLEDLSSGSAEVTDFGIRLFQTAMKEGENTLISPLSVLSALAMTANGAEGETLAQMEEVLGMPVEELNSYMHTYMTQLPEGEKYKLRLANSIWFTDKETFQVEQDFLQTNADYYGAQLYKRTFNERAVRDINAWVKQNTDEMIPEIVDEISADAVMYLVNALAFEAEWQIVYEKRQVEEGVFTLEDGTERKAELMYSDEWGYLEDELATGFVKYYRMGEYAFVALLPKEDVSVAEYVSSLTGVHVQELLAEVSPEKVLTAIPKFEMEYNTELKQVLMNMGMSDAFNMHTADFSGLGQNTEGRNIYINQVLHKTYISVGEQGTRAGAATAVALNDGSSGGPAEPPKKVYLNRPFVYMLIDTKNNLPFFIGTLMDVE
ncbi:MAG: serpin family protein [Lachnospiraceae bacterium]|nr:serpin family protein [Lachnospiraceae bacterium]